MGLFGGKKYIKCQQEEDGSVSCVAYKPHKDGKKEVTATLKAQLNPDGCSINTIDQDGNPEDMAELESHLSKRMRTKCKGPSEI